MTDRADEESLFDVAHSRDGEDTLFVDALAPGTVRVRPYATERWTIPSPSDDDHHDDSEATYRPTPTSTIQEPQAQPQIAEHVERDATAVIRPTIDLIDLTVTPDPESPNKFTAKQAPAKQPLRFRRKTTPTATAPEEPGALVAEDPAVTPRLGSMVRRLDVAGPEASERLAEPLPTTRAKQRDSAALHDEERARFEAATEQPTSPRKTRRRRWLAALLGTNMLIGGLVFAGWKNSQRAEPTTPIQLRSAEREVLIVPAGSTARTTIAVRNVTGRPLMVVGIESEEGAVALVSPTVPVLPVGKVTNLTIDVTPPPIDPILPRPSDSATAFVISTVAKGTSRINRTKMELSTLVTVPVVSPLTISEKTIKGAPTKVSALGDQIVVADADGTLQLFDLNGKQIKLVASLRQLAKPGRRVTGLATKDNHVFVAYTDWASVIGNVDRVRGAIADVTIDPKTLKMTATTLVNRLPSGPGNSGLGEISFSGETLVAAIGMVDGDATGVAGSLLLITPSIANRSAPAGVDATSDDPAVSVYATGLGVGTTLATTTTSVVVCDVGESDSLRIVKRGAFLGVPNPIRKETVAVTNGLGTFAGVGESATFVSAPRAYQAPTAWLGGNQSPGAVLIVGGSSPSPLANRIVIATRQGLRSVSVDGSETQVIGTAEEFGNVSDLTLGSQGQLVAVDAENGRLLIG